MTNEEQPDGYRPDEVTTADINIGQVIQGSMLLLVADMAAVDAALKFKSLHSTEFQKFYSHFLEVFLIAHDLLDLVTVVGPVETYFKEAKNLHMDTEMIKSASEALDLAVLMKQDLVDKGLWQVFAQAAEPPFMMDLIL